MNHQMRLEVQGATQQWVDAFMAQYNVPPYMMEDALNKVLSNLKDKVIIELLTSSAEPTQPQEEEVDGEQDNQPITVE